MSDPLKGRRSSHQTQWAAQFAVASELCKRGYEVALTMGNHPSKDILATSPADTSFGVDVKGLYKRNFWAVRRKPERRSLYYVFAFVPHHGANRFFIMTQAEVNLGIDADLERARRAAAERGQSPNSIGDFPGVAWAYAEQYEDCWGKLPA